MRKAPFNKIDHVISEQVTKIVWQLYDRQVERYGLPTKGNSLFANLDRSTLEIYAVRQRRGRAQWGRGGKRYISIPVWATKRGFTYLEWYCAHELAHQFNHYAGTNDSHGPHFMKWLKRICPYRSIHHELGYKPRGAAAAGIREKDATP